MRKLVITIAMLLSAGTVSATAAQAARWLTEPSCTATATTLTCTGRAAGIQRNNPLKEPELGDPVVGLFGTVRYSCSDPVFDFFESGFAPATLGPLASFSFHNGQTFTIAYSPLDTPSALMALFGCIGDWTRDPTYYNVSINVGWGFGSAVPVTALEGPVGTVLLSP